MSMDMLKRILDKSQAEARVIGVQLYHYNEPTLIPHMAEMVAECHRRGLPVFLSTNLVIWKNVPSILAESPEMFLISVSGFSQSVYERSHAGGDIGQVKRNMIEVSKLRKPGTTVQVSWHRYRYNEHEESMMRIFSQKLGFNFVPYATSIIPHDRAMKVWATGIDDPAGEDVLLPVKEAKQMCLDRKSLLCIIQEQVVAVNGRGELLLCSNFADSTNIIGSFFDSTISEQLAARHKNPICKACKSVGGHVYAMQAYTRSMWSPALWLEQIYRKLKLQGCIPWFTKFMTKTTYIRPQEKETL